ncbi:unnamed protein product [Rotaria socialis]|uniref:Uncharacterized protein n=1 Tax=Rotaria socialis TaxID=392032 RepID=A0A818WBI6_9BILA|nr:unnamed protein product [Rotaria socialis]CAF3323341.1 unnamed protein product [Rotaria socialis]CAF3412115.1 unnamed protein product [Rotaria socialis]CAF3440472.1 unnamed protein product [Rotaria socialis]CAF3723428.1 unnamed protein product [Rotaria socialis]
MDAVEKIVGSGVALFWLDKHIGLPGVCTQLKQEFESNTTNLYSFSTVDQCRSFLQSVKNRKLFCIIQGSLAKTVVPDIDRYEQSLSPVVYIFCLDVSAYSEWGQNYDCILRGGIFDHEQDVLTHLTHDLSEYAALKVQEYSFKRAACDEWAQNLARNAKRLRTEQCTLTFRTDPFSDTDTDCAEAQN